VPFWNRSKEPAYTLFYVADLHGSERCYRKFVNAGKFYGVDALVLGGDVTGKALVPLVRLADGAYEARFLGRTEIARDEAELATLEGQIRFNGFYPFKTDPDELAELATDPVRRETHFEAVISAAVRQWVSLTDERLEGSGIKCLVMPGNDDGEFVGEILSEGRNLINPEGRTIELGPYQVLSYGWSNVTPWKSPRELSEDELEARIEVITGDLEPGRPTIFNLHVPPYGTRIDDAPQIRADLSLVGGSSATMVPVGSTAVRRLIERHTPMLGLHGHIHESRGTARLGRTTCLNPGSDYNTGILKGAVVRLRGSEVEDIQFVAA
jgi:Icc-related predicted phosphoesterase